MEYKILEAAIIGDRQAGTLDSKVLYTEHDAREVRSLGELGALGWELQEMIESKGFNTELITAGIGQTVVWRGIVVLKRPRIESRFNLPDNRDTNPR